MKAQQLKSWILRSDIRKIQHLADGEKEGKAVEKSYEGVFNVSISPIVHNKASYVSIKTGITLNQMIKQALEKEPEDH